MSTRKFKHFFGEAVQRFGRFSHEAHVYATWLMLQDAPALSALAEFRQGLQALAAASGKADKYHETLTVAWFMLVLERQQRAETWEEFIARCPELLESGLVEQFYAPELLRDEAAKHHFIPPVMNSGPAFEQSL